MRIREEFKKSGDFWLPSEPDRKVHGTLSISDGGTIELEVDGLFNDEIEALLRDRLEPIERIVGDIDGLVTLDDCYYKTQTIRLGGGRSKSLIHVNRVFTSVGYDEDEIPRFNSVTFSVEGLDEWIGISGINVETHFEESAATISYQRPEDISINLDNGMRLLITFHWTPPGAPIIKEAKISQKTYFQLVTEEERELKEFTSRELKEFTSVAHKITTFLCFAIGQTVALDSMEATSDDLRQDIGDPISIYYPSRPYDTDEPKIRQHDMLFRFRQIQNDAERIINNWIEAYERINPTFDSYFSTQIGQPYLTVKFLALVQGLEAYHHREKNLAAYRQRKKGDRELYLREKIEDVIEPFKGVIGNEDKRGELIDGIVNTRNYLTHYKPEKESKAAKDEDLWNLCVNMELLFQLHFLRLIGFNREEIDSIVANCRQFQWKLNQQL